MPEMCLDFIPKRGVGLLPCEGQERRVCGSTEGGLPGGDVWQTQEGDVQHEGRSPELGAGVHRDDGRGGIHAGIM